MTVVCMPGRSARAQWRREKEPSSHTLAGHKLDNMEYVVVLMVVGMSSLLYWNTLNADFAYDDR